MKTILLLVAITLQTVNTPTFLDNKDREWWNKLDRPGVCLVREGRIYYNKPATAEEFLESEAYCKLRGFLRYEEFYRHIRLKYCK